MKIIVGLNIIILIALSCYISVAQSDSTINNTPDPTLISREDNPDIYIDCEFCDKNYMKQEMTFIDYVRDSEEADIYIIITRQNTGSGGEEYSIFIVGQKDFSFMNDIQKFTTEPDASDEDIRSGIVRTIKLSLMRYITKTNIADDIEIVYNGSTVTDEVVDDKWRSWVFEIDLGAWINGEATYRGIQLWGDISAVKITEDIKIETELGFLYAESRYDIDGERILALRRIQYWEGLMVKSLGEHWSVGGYLGVTSSTYSNLDLRIGLSPALEYNLFKYSESTRRQLRILYRPIISYNNYIETTVYGKDEEILAQESLGIAFEIIEKWGSISTSVSGSNYFHDFSKNRLDLNTELKIRVFKGFNVSLSGGVSLIHDQISLPGGDVSSEDILLRQQQLATQYSYWCSAGITYTFGSVYNNVVNPRFGN